MELRGFTPVLVVLIRVSRKKRKAFNKGNEPGKKDKKRAQGQDSLLSMSFEVNFHLKPVLRILIPKHLQQASIFPLR